MNDTPTEKELLQWLRLEPRPLEFIEELQPLLAHYLFHGHTKRLIIHDLLFVAYALASGPVRPEDLGHAPEPPTPEQAGNYIHDFLNALIEYHQDFPPLPTHPTNSDTTH